MAHISSTPHRVATTAPWSRARGRSGSLVASRFQRHAGVAIAPKTLRSIFITWLKDTTADGSILKSAAHAMKHSEMRQGSSDYDQVRSSNTTREIHNPTHIDSHNPTLIDSLNIDLHSNPIGAR